MDLLQEAFNEFTFGSLFGQQEYVCIKFNHQTIMRDGLMRFETQAVAYVEEGNEHLMLQLHEYVGQYGGIAL